MNEKIKKRAKSLIIPFVIWNSFAFFYLFFREGFILPFENLKDLIMHLTLDPYNIPLWYIFTLILLLIPAMLIIKLKGKKITSLLIYFIICIITLCYCNLESLKAIRIYEIQRIIQMILAAIRIIRSDSYFLSDCISSLQSCVTVSRGQSR